MCKVRTPAMTITTAGTAVQYGWQYWEMSEADANEQVYFTRRGCKLHRRTDCLGERDVVETLTYAQAIERNVKHCKCCYGKWSHPAMTHLHTETLPDYRVS